MTIDRDALIEAARTAAAARGWHTEWTTTAAMIDAVLPLIADAIETLTKFPPSGPFGEALGIERAANLVRSLARPGTGE